MKRRRRNDWNEGGRFAACQILRERPEFPRFWFEGNQAFREITTIAQLKNLIRTHADAHRSTAERAAGLLGGARRNPGSLRSIPEFGFYAEHNGEETLAEFLLARGVSL